MSAPSDNMPIAAPEVRTRPMLLRHLPYFIGAAALVALAATMRFDGYILHILMQATTFAIAVFGLSVVLGLCGQINLAQAAFFGFGAYAVGIGTSDCQISYWLCLVAGCVMALLAGAVLGLSTLRLGGHYLAMVTISFQQIVTLIMINAIWLTHGPDGVSRIGRPDLFKHQQSYLAFCVAMLALVGYFVWHLPDTRIGRAMRAVRDNELAAGVVGIDVFRTKVYAFALSAVRPRRRPVRRRICLCQPGPVLVRGIDRVPDDVAARWRGIADRLGDRHGSVDPDPGMAAVPQERPRIVSGDLRARRDPDHPLHAGWYLGLFRNRLRSLARADQDAAGRGGVAVEAGNSRWRHRARRHRAFEIFRRSQGGRRRRYPGEARRGSRPDRTEWLRQDHHAQRVVRPLQGDRGQDFARRYRPPPCRRISARQRASAGRSRTSACSVR
jgi:hypothetical protein